LSIEAADPDGQTTGEAGGFTDGDTITVRFSESTNRPNVATKANIDNLFNFTQSGQTTLTGDSILGTDYVGTWTSASTLVITIIDNTGGAGPIVNDPVNGFRLGVEKSANLKNQAGTSQASTSISPALEGDFGEKAGPLITSIRAADPDGITEGEAGGFTDGDTITVRFSEATNTPPVATKANLDGLFTFSQSLGSDYTGVFDNSLTLIITIVDSTGATPPAINELTLTVKADGVNDLKDALESSEASTSESPPLIGTFGDKPGPFTRLRIRSAAVNSCKN